MPNSFFQFKQFLINQDACAMKVCTDACLFGAWVAEKLHQFNKNNSKVLDIGTGTGLLALMVAQKNTDALIDAVEIDEAASRQAGENFNASVFGRQLQVHHQSIRHFSSSTQKKYDVIICNPPFYKNNLKSNNERRNLALHSHAFSMEELIFCVKNLLADDGSFFMLLPFSHLQTAGKLPAINDLMVCEKVFIKQTPKNNFFRVMCWIERKAAFTHSSEITIKTADDTYSAEFVHLLKDYYLYL